MIIFSVSDTDAALAAIIALQQSNLPQNLSMEEMRQQGFVTVSHSLADLQQMHSYEPNIIATDNGKLVAYLLAMTQKSKADIPLLVPMFESFSSIVYKHKPVAAYQYIVVGQVCIHKDYRGCGLLYECYQAYKNYFSGRYEIAVTEIACNNRRSIQAHKKIGFTEIHCYTDSSQTEWSVVAWDWLQPAP